MFKRLSLLALLVLIGCERNDPGQVDADGDGFVAADCRDNDAASFPGAEELCDSVDNDCDGEIEQQCDRQLGGLFWGRLLVV